MEKNSTLLEYFKAQKNLNNSLYGIEQRISKLENIQRISEDLLKLKKKEEEFIHTRTKISIYTLAHKNQYTHSKISIFTHSHSKNNIYTFTHLKILYCRIM